MGHGVRGSAVSDSRTVNAMSGNARSKAAGQERPAARPARIPVTLIGGYLGAGKTSLLNHLLTHAGGEPVAVLVNDFGALGLDAALVARRDARTVTLTNGCVCCSIADDFGAALDAQVRSREPPARIVVETSGVADPAKSAHYATGWPGVRLDAAITVVDAEAVRAQAEDRFVGDLVLRQIASADVLVVNKRDRVTPPELCATADWLTRHAPRAALVETCHGRAAPAVLLGVATGGGRREPAASGGPAAFGAERAAGAEAGSTGHGDIPFVRVACRSPGPVERAALAAVLDALPKAVVRFKGVVRLRERPGRPYLLQGVGRRWSLEPAAPAVPAALAAGDGCAIDFIGIGPAGPIEAAVRTIAPAG